VKSISILQHERLEEAACHPATRAWCKLTKHEVVPERVEVIQEAGRGTNDQPSVYRLTGIGPGGTNVIAKRCNSAAACIEWSTYQNVLSQLPVSVVGYYGLIADVDQQFCWLLLEDAGEDPYLLEDEEHRILAGGWLGAMNVSAQQLPAAARLPDRGPNFYLERLLASRETIRKILQGSSFSPRDAAVLNGVISHCDALEKRWNGIERFCNRMPQTLVHGDLLVQNARVRRGAAGNSLMILDWEAAGWGIPAADLVQFVGKSLSPDLRTYYSVVCSSWPSFGLTHLQTLTEVGRLFRLINSLDWANWGYRAVGVDWFNEKLNWSERELANWLRTTEVPDK
jgi:hypothetical protein